jgi:hypothetical protein
MAFKGDIRTYIRQIISTANQNIAQVYRDYDLEIDKISNPYKYADFWGKLSILGSGAYDAINGSWTSATGFMSGSFVAVINALEMINNIDQTELASNIATGGVAGAFTNSIEQRVNRLDEAGYLFVNDMKATASMTAVSVGVMIQNLADLGLNALGVNTNWNTKWAVDAAKSIAQIQTKTAYEIRTADPSKNIFTNPNVSPNQNMSGANVPFTAEQFERSADWYKDAEENYAKYKEFLGEDYNQTSEQMVNFVNSLKEGLDKLTDNKFLRDITFKTKADEVYGQFEWYQQLSGVINSMAAVLMGKYISKFIPNPTAAAAFGNAYFGIQVLGNSFSEARKNGASMQDAYTYAYANAALETLIENIGGATPGGKINVLPRDFNAWFRAVKTIVKNAAEEGVEEIASEFTTTGFDLFKEPISKQEDYTFERFATETAFKRVLTAFAAGAISGGIFGGGQYFVNRNTLNEKINIFQDAQRLKVETPAQKKEAARILKETSNNVLQALNNPKARGYIRTKDGKYKIGTLSSQDKIAYIYQTGLSNYLEVNWQETLGVATEQEVQTATSEQLQQGIEANNVVFAYREGVVFNEDIFKSFYGVDGTGARIQVDDKMWAINKATVGVELTTPEVGEGKKLRLVPTSALNDAGKLIIENAKNKKVPIVVVSMTPEGKEEYKGTIAFYSNGVIYVNQEATGLTESVIKKEIVKHELIHLIASQSPEIYEKLEKLVDESLDIVLNLSAAIGQKVKVQAKGGKYSALIKLLNQLGYQEKLNASLNDILLIEEENLRKRLTPEQLAQQGAKIQEVLKAKIEGKLKEEAVAYFAEIIVKDTREFVEALEGKDAGLVESIKEVFADKQISLPSGEFVKNPFAELSSRERKTVREFTRQVSTAVKKVTEERSLAKFFVEKAFGGNISASQYIVPSLLKKYGEASIFRALIELNILNKELEKQGKQKEDILNIDYTDSDGKKATDQVKINDIFFFKDAAEIFKKVDGNVTKTSLQTFVDKFTYDPKQADYYQMALTVYDASIAQQIVDLRNAVDINNKEEYEKTQKTIEKLMQRAKVARLMAMDFARHVSGESVVTISDFAEKTTWNPTNPRLNRDYVREITGTEERPTGAYQSFVISAQMKRVLLAQAIYNAEQTSIGETGKGIKVRKDQSVSNVELNAISAILRSLKSFLELYSPVVSLRTDEWVNSAFISTINKPGGLNLSLDFLSELEKEHGTINRGLEDAAKTTQKLDKYDKSMEILVDNYRAALTTLLSTTHEYRTGSGMKTRTFSLEEYDFEVGYESDDSNIPSILTISIIPTRKLIDQQIEKVRAIEERRTAEAITQEKATAEPNLESFKMSAVTQKKIENESKVLMFAKSNLLTLMRNNSIPANLSTINIIDYSVATNSFSQEVLESFKQDGVNVLDVKSQYDYSLVDSNSKPLSVGQVATFKDSYMRDEKGRLVVLYHGTMANFENFSVYTAGSTGTKMGVGFYFTNNRKVAFNFAGGSLIGKGENIDAPKGETKAEKQTRDDLGKDFKVRSFYLNIKKPIYAEFNEAGDVLDFVQDNAWSALDSDGKRPVIQDKYKSFLFSKNESDTIIYTLLLKANLGVKQLIENIASNVFENSSEVADIFRKLAEKATNVQEVAKVLSFAILLRDYSNSFYQYDSYGASFPSLSKNMNQLLGDLDNLEINVDMEQILNIEQEYRISLGADMLRPHYFIRSLFKVADVVLNETNKEYKEYDAFDNTAREALQAPLVYSIINEVSGFDGFINSSMSYLAEAKQSGKKGPLNETEGTDDIVVAWFQNQMKAVTNYNPDDSINVYGQKNDEVVFNTPSLTREIPYNEENIVFVTPHTELKESVKTIEKAIKSGPLVVANLPATWVNSYKNHNALPSTIKIVSITRADTPMMLGTKKGERLRSTNIAVVVFANKLSEKYLELADISLTGEQNTTFDFDTKLIKDRTSIIEFLVNESDRLQLQKYVSDVGKVSQELVDDFLNHKNMRFVLNQESGQVRDAVDSETKYSTPFSDFITRFLKLNEANINIGTYGRLDRDYSKYTLPIEASSAIIVTFKNPESAKFFDSIDFKNLVEKGSVAYGKEFSVADLVSNYKANREALEKQQTPDIFDNSTAPRKTSVSNLTEEKIRLMNKLFGNSVASSLFVVDNKGNLKTKFSRFINKRQKLNSVTSVSGKKYDGRTYAININYDADFADMSNRVADEEYVKISDLNPEQKLYFDALVSAGFNFGFYKSSTAQGKTFLGYSSGGQKTNFFYINIKSIGTNLKEIVEIAIHEQFHEIFKSIPNVSDSLGKTLESVFFDYDATDKKYYPTSIAWDFFNNTNMGVPDPTFDKKNVLSLNYFINSYLLSANSYSYMKGIVASPEDIRDVLATPTADLAKRTRGNEWVRTKNEVMAQIVGKLLADRKVFETVLKGRAESSLVFLDAFSKLIKNSVHEQAKRDLLNVAAEQYADINNMLAQELNKKYPFKPLFTNADINEFIKAYTDGLYSSKAALVKAYLDERQAKRSGKATAAFNSVLFMASQYEKLVQNGTETYTTLAEFLAKVFNNATYAFKAPANEVLFSLKPEMFSGVQKLVKKMKEIAVGIRDGKINMTPSNPKAMNPVTLTMESTVFDLGSFIVSAQNQLQEFLIEYAEISDEMKSLFSLPNESVIAKEFDMSFFSVFPPILTTLTNNPDSISLISGLMLFSAVDRFEKTFPSIIENYELALDYMKGNVQKINSAASLSGAIIGLREELFTKETQETSSLIGLRLNNALQKMTEGSLQAKAPLSQEANKIIERIKKIAKIFKEFTNIDALKKDVLLELEAIVKDGLDILSTKFEITSMTAEQIDIQKDFIEALTFTFNKHIIAAYTQLGLLTGDVVSVIKLIPTSVATVSENNELIKHYQNLKKPAEYSPKTMASAIGNLVSLYGQRYTSSLSENDQTHDEFALEINTEFTQYKVKMLPTRDARFDKINFQTPQDYFLKLREFFKGKDIKIFDVLWKRYVESAVRAEDILRDFDVSYLNFKKQHKNIQKNSLEEAIDPDTEDGGLDTDVVLQIDEDVLFQIKEEVKKEKQQEKEKIDGLSEKIKQVVAEKKVLNDQIKVLKEQRKQYVRGSFEYQKLSAQIRALESSKAPFLQQEKDLRAQKKAVVKIDADAQFKLKVYQYLSNNPNIKPNQKITKGQLVTLYLSVSRELEMEEISESNAQNGTVNIINPTNHFGFGNSFDLFDAEILRKKGLKAAQKAARPFIVLSKKEDLRQYLENLLTDEDRISIDFAQQNFKNNYTLLNQEFRARFGTDLPYQSIYIPFSTLESNYERELDLKIIKRRNIGVASGMVTETTLGASTPLKIENIFSVVENHAKVTSNYSFERLIKDWQNLLVNKSDTISSLQRKINGVVGKENNFIEFFNRMFADILNYSDITEDGWVKFYRKRLSQTRAATLAFGVKSPLKQLGSLFNISVKNKSSFLNLVTNLVKTMPKNKYYKWLMENSSNFYFRAKISNVPDLAKEINSSPALKTGNIIDQVLKLGLKGMGYLDAVVIVAAFKTYADEIRGKYNLAGMNQVDEEQILEEAYKKLFDEVLLYGVANSNPAFRSHFTNDRNWFIQLLSKFQSENVLHWSAIIRQLDLVANKVQGAPKELLRQILALLLSGFWSSLVSVGVGVYVTNRIEPEDANFEFWVNDFLWNNVVGSLPYVNSLTNLISFDLEAPLLIQEGYQFSVPLYTELFTVVEALSTGVFYKDTGEFNFRKALRILESVLTPFGVPLRNIRSIVEIVFGTAAGVGNTKAIDVVQWFAGQSDSQAFSEAIKTGNRTYINKYVEDAYTDARVVRHIVDLTTADSSIRLSLKNEDSFITVDEEGKRTTHNVPLSVKSAYRRLTLKAIRSLMSKREYRRLTAKKKAETLQRVINYYWNYMKDDILNKPKRTRSNVDEESAVVERAIFYAYN